MLGTGALVYDIQANQFKGKINNTWQTLASGAAFSATDQQVLFYNETSGQMEGAIDLLWQYDPTDLHLTIGLGGTPAYLVMNQGPLPFPNFGGEDGSIKFNNGDLLCMKGGIWTSLTQVGTGANAAGPQNSIQFNNINNQFGGDANLSWASGTETISIGTPAVNNGVSIIGTGSGINLADGSGGPGIAIVGGANPQINMIRAAGGGVIINAIGDATFTGTSGFLVLIDADNLGGSLVKSQLFQTYDPSIATGLQISSVVGGGGVNTITQILDNHTTQGFSFNYPLGPNGGMQLKANNMQFMQSGSGGIGSGFQFIFDNDTLGLGDSVFRIVKGITGQTYSANSVFRCDGNGSLIWAGTVGNNIIPQIDNTFTLGSNPSNAWKDITVNNVNAGGAAAGTGIFANDLVLNGNTIMPSFGFVSSGEGINIGELSGVGGPGAGGFRQVFAREFIAGANGNLNGSFLAHSSAGTSIASLSATGPDLSLSNSVQANSVILSTNSNVIAGGINPALVFTNSSVGTVQNMILYGNNTVTGDKRDKILNIGYDSTLANSPVNGTSGYQMQFTLGGAGAGKLDVAGTGTFTGDLKGGTLTDGTAQITGGVGTGFTSITSTTLTDGTAQITGGVGTGFTSITATTLTDGTLSINSGNITGGINGTFSGTLSLSHGPGLNPFSLTGGTGGNIYKLTPFQATTPTDVGVALNIPDRIGTGASTRAAYHIRNTSAITAGVCITGTTALSHDTCIILDCALQGGLEGPGKTSAIYLGWKEETILEPHASWPHLADRAIPQAVSGSGQTIYPVLLINGPTLITGDSSSPIFGWDFTTETQEDIVIGYDTASGKGLDVRGTLTKTTGSFKIDHPDPEKINTHNLYHSFVESPTAGDNLYRYRVTTTVDNSLATIA